MGQAWELGEHIGFSTHNNIVTSPISRPEKTDLFMLCFINQSNLLKKIVAKFVPKTKYDKNLSKHFFKEMYFH